MTLLEYFRIPSTENRYWQIGTLIGLIGLMSIFFFIAFLYKQKYAQFRSTPDSIKTLLTIRNHDLSTSLGNLKGNTTSVCTMLTNKTAPYNVFEANNNALVNWRPLTVRLAGYLGGIYTARDGVFDMQSGIQHALDRGARGFVFEIDYLDESPCKPVLIHRDSQGYMRSLHTGSILEGCKRLTDKAFETNRDPVLIIIYLRRIPSGLSQQAAFFKAIAKSLSPLSTYHLGLKSQGNFHNCKSESHLFTSPITDYQNNFIVLTNYNTNQIPATENPKDNLDFWTNARIYQDPSGISGSIGSVTSSAPNGAIAYAQIGSTQQLLNIPSSNRADYLSGVNGNTSPSSSTFKIALSDLEYSLTTTEIDTLMNELGIQCVPLDILRLSVLEQHEKSIKLASQSKPILDDLINAKNTNDPLSFWIYGGWSRKYNIGIPPVIKNNRIIPGFVTKDPVVPKKPSASTNSNGGLVTIAP
jgi:hypothetical protein